MTRRAAIVRRLRNEHGVVAPMVALFMIVLLGVAALAVDLGFTYLQKRRLQAAVDYAVLAAAQKLPDATTATSDAQSFLSANWKDNGNNSDPTVNSVTTCTFDPANPQQCNSSSTACASSGPCQIAVKASASVPTFFGNIFGFSNINVSAQGSACGECGSVAVKYDVVVVLDRSNSMCYNASNQYVGCSSPNSNLSSAKAGVLGLLNFFDPSSDRLGLAVLPSGDSVAPFAHVGTYPCDTINMSDGTRPGQGPFYGTLGDFMDGTAASHDSWLIAPLSSAFKNADGSINTSSPFVSDLNCLQGKGWTPMAPAVQAATQELLTDGRPDAHKIIIYFGDGGGNVQPMRRDANGNATSTPSWYTPTPGNNLRPCHDAVGQAAVAKAAGIEVYTIGYNLNDGDADTCYANNIPNNRADVEAGIDARSTLQQMASDPSHYYEKPTAGEVTSIFNAIGHSITSNETRITS
jgi:Flp pilus assembly protein TadG